MVYPSPKIFEKDSGLCKKKEKETHAWKHDKNGKIAPVSKIPKKGERTNHTKMSSYFIHHIHHIHTCAHLDQVVWLVAPKDPVFDLAIYEKHVCHMTSPPTAPHIILLGVGCERRQTNALVRNHTHWVIREYHSRNFDFFLKTYKTSGLTADQGISNW